MEPDPNHPPYVRLADALRGRRSAILSTWEHAVRRDGRAAHGFAWAALWHGVPVVFEHLCQALANGRSAAFEALAGRTSAHGVQRFEQRYTIADLLVEYRLLRRSAFEQAAAGIHGGLTTAEVLALNLALDAVGEGAVTAFGDAQRTHLERANLVESKLQSYLAHDQRNHFNHALLLLEIHSAELAQHPDLAQSAAELRKVREAIQATTRGMERLMQAERLRRGTVELDWQPIDPADLLRSVAR